MIRWGFCPGAQSFMVRITPFRMSRGVMALLSPLSFHGSSIYWKPEFDSRIGHHVKKGKRGACRHKAATVLPDRTAAA